MVFYMRNTYNDYIKTEQPFLTLGVIMLDQQTLIIVRGLSGSGKSTFSLSLKKKADLLHFEADQFFETNEGYKFDFSKLSLAHEWCQSQTAKALMDGRSVVVSNTFVQCWTIEPYVNLAKQFGVPVIIIEMTTQFKNVHGLTDQDIAKQAEKWEQVHTKFESVPVFKSDQL